MIDCQGCNDLVFKRDGSHSCFLFPYSEQISNCPCMKCLCKVICATCLIKMVCLRKLECYEFCSQAAIMRDNKSSYVRCLKNIYPSMHERLVLEGKIL
jgi:hypothetical protein